MLSLILKCCEYVFPEREDHKLVRFATADDVLRLLNPTDARDFVFLLDFKEPLVRALVHEAKFKANQKAWDLLALALRQYLKHQPGGSVLIPVPLSTERQWHRGYNQIYEVAKRAISELPHLTLDNSTLRRQKNTAPQTTLSRKERLKNVKDAFVVVNAKALMDARVIIIDDVATTGATLKATKDALIKHSPKSITLLSLAH